MFWYSSSTIGNLGKKIDIKLKYNGLIYDPIMMENLSESNYMLNGENRLFYSRKFKFKIDDFLKFRMADDKSIILTRKEEDGKKITEQFPVKWGLILYRNPSLPL